MLVTGLNLRPIVRREPDLPIWISHLSRRELLLPKAARHLRNEWPTDWRTIDCDYLRQRVCRFALERGKRGVVSFSRLDFAGFAAPPLISPSSRCFQPAASIQVVLDD